MTADPLRENAGVFFLALVAAATLILWIRDWTPVRSDVRARRRITYRAINFLFWGGLPWFVMAVGNRLGSTQDPLEFLNPNTGPFAYAFLASLIMTWTALLFWLFAKSGAQELAESGHFRLAGVPVRSPGIIKLIFVLCVIGALAAVVWFGITNAR